MTDLKNIKSPADIKQMTIGELKELAAQMRQAIIGMTSTVGGHVGPNLGSVESIIALHYVFNAPADKIVFDVSHQDFPHKMLTGRARAYTDPDKYDSIGEYTNPKESPDYDIFYAGHTSPSISLCVGLAKARDIAEQKHNIIAYIGDGSLSGGEALEGLNAAGKLDSNLIVIVNDNQMAIAENHGALYDNLQQLRETNGTCALNIFKSFGFDYRYIAEGNDLSALIGVMKSVRNINHPTLIHINTQKGEGYAPAERDRETFHYQGPYNPADGMPRNNGEPDACTLALKQFLLDKCRDNDNMLIVTSATPESFLFMKPEREAAGKHYLDVAIAEQTAVAVMAGAARAGTKVIYPVIASFIQRAYDQLMQDWAMNNSPALMPVLASGINGIPDQTHLGFWDIAMLTSIPDIVYLAPTNVEEFKAMMQWAYTQNQHKVALRMPTYSEEHADGPVDTDYSDINTFKITHKGSRVAIIGAGDFYIKALQTARILRKKGIDPTIINPRFISGVDTRLLRQLQADHTLVATIEDGSLEGGFGQRVASALGTSTMKVLNFGLAKQFEDRYQTAQLEHKSHLEPSQIAADIIKNL